MLNIFFQSGLTLGRVVMVEVTKKVIISLSYSTIPGESKTEPQIGAVNAVYSYTLVAIL